MIEPVKCDEALRMEILTTDPGDEVALWWLGQSGFLLKHARRYLLFDPYLSESLTAKYANTDKPHVRMTRRPIDPARLDMTDVITSSHDHTDHFDAATLRPLKQANPRLRLVLPAANRRNAIEKLQTSDDWFVPVNDGEMVEVAGFQIRAVPAAHETIDRDADGRCKYLGYVVQSGRTTIYHSGDCVPFDGQVKLLRTFKIDIAILPINGRRPERRVQGNFWGREAARLAHDIGATLVIPCHYEMFEFNTESPDEFVAECRRLEQAYRVLRCGEQLTV
jgi:L-ascorbate metabolism protein UlaG (beta-lactamase superfamily)